MRKVLLSLAVSVFFISVFVADARAGIMFGSKVRVDSAGPDSNQRYLDITLDSGANIYAVWEDCGVSRDIYFGKSVNGGVSFGASVRVDDTALAITEQIEPSVAVGSTGIVYVVWSDNRNGSYDIYFAKSTDGGATFSTNVRVDDTGAGTSVQTHPAVAVAANGDIYVTWSDNRNGTTSTNIYFAKSTDGGATFGANVRVDNTARSYNLFSSVAVSGSNIYISWHTQGTNEDVFVAKSVDGGATFGPSVQVNSPSTGSQTRSSIAVDAAGNVYVAWRDTRNSVGDIYFAKSTNAGVSFGTNVRITDGTFADNRYPDIAVDTSNKIYICWDSDRADGFANWDIYIAVSSDAGASFGQSLRVNDVDEPNWHIPSLAVDVNKNIYIGWETVSAGFSHAYCSKGIEEWVLNIADVPWYQTALNYNSTGAAASQMTLNFIRSGAGMADLSQDQIYQYIKGATPPSPYVDLTADEVHNIMDYFDPPRYNFALGAYDPATDPQAMSKYMRDICFWMAYNVPGVAKQNVPATVPLYGGYNHWVTLKGCSATANPWTAPTITVSGFWVKDPLITGLGQDTYVTATVCASTYFLPLTTSDGYNGKLVRVSEPPPEQCKAKVFIEKGKPDDANLVFMGVKEPPKTKLINGKLRAPLGAKPLVTKNGWKDILPVQLLDDPECKKAFANTVKADPILVKRAGVNGSDYYLLPFVRKNLLPCYNIHASGVVVIDAVTGAFKEATWTKKPEKFLKVNRNDAIDLVLDLLRAELKNKLHSLPGNVNFEKRKSLKSAYDVLDYYVKAASTELLWSPKSAYSKSPYHPYWKVNANGYIFYVTQDGKVASEPDLAKIIAEILANKRMLMGPQAL